MDHNELKGLIGAVGKALALRPDGGSVVEALERLDSPEAFRAFLDEREIGISEPSRSTFIQAVTDEAHWRDYQAQLAASTNMQYHEYTAPGS